MGVLRILTYAYRTRTRFTFRLSASYRVIFYVPREFLLVCTRVSQKVMSPVNFNRFNLHIFSRNFKGV